MSIVNIDSFNIDKDKCLILIKWLEKQSAQQEKKAKKGYLKL